MRIVVLGGTGFLSSAVVAAALARGHDVAAVSRGTSGRPPQGVTWLQADRDDPAQLTAALGRLEADDGRPEAVIDVCGFTVAGARAGAEVLAEVDSYAYVSSISAYRDWPPGPVRGEGDPLWSAADDLDEYGPMKAESERVLARRLGDRLLVARAGLIIGPGDDTRRLTTWLHRMATSERVVVPEELEQPVGFVDARDLAAWLVGGVERGLTGPVTATGPVGMTTFGGLLEACRDAVVQQGGRVAELVPTSEEQLLADGVRPWVDLPFWLPRDVASTAWDVDTTRARELGLPSRPIEESVADTWRWVLDTGFAHPGPSAPQTAPPKPA